MQQSKPAPNPETVRRSFSAGGFGSGHPVLYPDALNLYPACSRFSLLSPIAALSLTRSVPNKEKESKFLIREGFE
jgi:hypothetical protein